MAIRKGAALNNVNETWNRNEQLRESENNPGAEPVSGAASTGSELQQTIQEEATEYDNADKEERRLDGERATVSDTLNDKATT